MADQDITQIQPDWKVDGHGLRGLQPDRPPLEAAHPVSMEFGISDRRSFGGETGGGKIQVTVEDVSGYTPGSGVETVDNVDVLTFDQDLFEIFDGGGGQCVVRLKTCDAVCGAS